MIELLQGLDTVSLVMVIFITVMISPLLLYVLIDVIKVVVVGVILIILSTALATIDVIHSLQRKP